MHVEPLRERDKTQTSHRLRSDGNHSNDQGMEAAYCQIIEGKLKVDQ